MAWVAVGVGAVGAGSAYLSSKASKKAGGVQRSDGMSNADYAKRLALEVQTQKDMAQYALGMYPDLNKAQIAGQTQTRQANLSDLQGMGSDYQTALQGMSPLWSKSLDSLGGMVAGAGQPDALGQQISQTALDNLRLGSGLSDQQVRDVTQGTRQGLASRGMAMGNNALGAELLGRDSYGQTLLAQRQQQALSAEGQNLQRQEMGQNFTLNAAQAGQNALNPTLSLLGAPALNVGMATQFANPSATLGAASSLTGQQMDYNQQVNSWNAASQRAGYQSQANLYGALGGSLLGMAGQYGGYQIQKPSQTKAGVTSAG